MNVIETFRDQRELIKDKIQLVMQEVQLLDSALKKKSVEQFIMTNSFKTQLHQLNHEATELKSLLSQKQTRLAKLLAQEKRMTFTDKDNIEGYMLFGENPDKAYFAMYKKNV